MIAPVVWGELEQLLGIKAAQTLDIDGDIFVETYVNESEYNVIISIIIEYA